MESRLTHEVHGVMAGLVLALMLGLIPLAVRAQGRKAEFSLAAAYPPGTLRTLLMDRAAWHPFPVLKDRQAWEALPAEARTELLRMGEAVLTEPMPALPATLYLKYAREGDRGRFEGPYFERRRRLHRLVLAECVENQGRFVDAIADHLWAICEESTWCVPAHVGAQKAGVGLPEVDEPIVDLFAAQTGASVAWTLYLLGGRLAEVSPVLERRAAGEVDRRILTPYLERDFGWMGFGARSRDDRPNNWNPWINGNVLTAALLVEGDADRRVRLVHRVLDSLDRFIQPYPEDGGCDEGPSYWSRAGGSVLDGLDWLASATDGKARVFEVPLIREMGRFLYRVHLAGDWYVNLGDCPARMAIDRDLAFRYGERIGDQALRDQGTSGATLGQVLSVAGGTDLGRALWAIQDLEAILAGADRPLPLVRDVWLGSEDMQMMVARDRAGTTEGFCVAAWGGHNAQSHNHNDVGNLLLFADGQPVLVDLGAPTYTAKTFSRRRYEIPAMQSSWHNLPEIRGRQQSAGRQYGARGVAYRTEEEFAELTMDLAGAWTEEAAVTSWRRTVRLERGREVRLTDAFELREEGAGTVSNLITPIRPELRGAGRLDLVFGKATPGGRRGVSLRWDPARLQVEVEPFAVDDRRLEAVWGGTMYRIRISASTLRSKDEWTVRMVWAE